jgi:hypothetical protein
MLIDDAPIKVVQEVAIAGAGTDGMRWHRAWPGVEALADGALLAVFKESVDHNRSDDAAVFAARSEDGGMTWPWRRAVAAEPGWGCITNHGLTRLADGTVLVPVVREQHLSAPDPITGATRVIRTAFTRSGDGGRQWGPCGAELAFDQLHPLFACAYGRVQELAGGRLMAPVYGLPRRATNVRLRSCGVAFSDDGGQTWRDFAPIYEDLAGDICPSETDVIRLRNGSYLAMIRANAPRRLYRSYSHDGGRTWTPIEPTDLPGQSPALIALASGALLCGYRDLTPEKPGMACAVSPDGGSTWTPLGQLSSGANNDCAYPSFTRLHDGGLYCAFYTAAMPAVTGASEVHGLVIEDHSAADLPPGA